jgi:hypothetical protein
MRNTTLFLHTGMLLEEFRHRAEQLDAFVFEKLELVKTMELLARLDQTEAQPRCSP